MIDSTTYFLLVPPLILVAAVCLTNRWANAHAVGMRRAITAVALLQFIISAIVAMAFALGWVPEFRTTLVSISDEFPIDASVYYDGVSGLMLALVSMIGWIICQYSIRYLDGETTQGRYFRWTSFTIGAVSLMVISGNLLMFTVAWVMTSLGLHQLLMHYGHRPAARRAAWTKFAISRLGDAGLIAAMVIIYVQFKTLDFAELFALAKSHPTNTTAMQVACFLLVFGAVTKSAQFPFHTWLPQTMETPTPVSALMHAGIVNAGGYLMIRSSTLLVISPWAMATLAIIGGVTAFYASAVMLTQTSVKKSLAYSTIAQMGFMLLQCGLGAFSAAMLHILAHSLYKAYAFLSSGSVPNDRVITHGALSPTTRSGWEQFAMAGVTIIILIATAFTIFGINPATKPGGFLLGGILFLSLTHWLGQVLRFANRYLRLRAIAVAGGLCLVYAASFMAIDKFIATSLPTTSLPAGAWIVNGLVLFGMIGLFALQTALANGCATPFLNKWRVHVSNGFYVETLLRRALGPLLNT